MLYFNWVPEATSTASTHILWPRLPITYNEVALSHLTRSPQVKTHNKVSIPPSPYQWWAVTIRLRLWWPGGSVTNSHRSWGSFCTQPRGNTSRHPRWQPPLKDHRWSHQQRWPTTYNRSHQHQRRLPWLALRESHNQWVKTQMKKAIVPKIQRLFLIIKRLFRYESSEQLRITIEWSLSLRIHVQQ